MMNVEVRRAAIRETREDLGNSFYVRLSPWREAEEAVLRAPRDLFKTFRAEPIQSVEEGDLEDYGRLARELIDEHLVKDGAVLFRGLPARSAEEFRIFWDACVSSKRHWEYVHYEPFGGHRSQMAGIDLATNTPAPQFLAPHNEMIYNPQPNDVIGLYCLQEADAGGESLMVWNRDYANSVPAALKDFVIEHGGIAYERKYHDASRPDRPALSFVSWQERCELRAGQGKREAEQYWTQRGFKAGNLLWDEQDTLTVRNVEPGWIPDRNSGEGLWFNAISVYSAPLVATMMNFVVRMGDGTQLPFTLVEELKKKLLAHTYALKLMPGDWLVLDNLQVQHGRAPYVDGPRKRTVLAVYANFPKQ